MSDPLIFTTIDRKRVPVPAGVLQDLQDTQEDLGVKREAWFKGSATPTHTTYYSIPPDQVRSTTIEDVAKAWAQDWKKLYDRNWTSGQYHILAPIEDVVKYREYDREGENALPNSSERIDELTEKIRTEGFTIPVHITVYKDGQRPRLSEGNHRLVAAQRLGLKEIPVVFFFYVGNASRW